MLSANPSQLRPMTTPDRPDDRPDGRPPLPPQLLAALCDADAAVRSTAVEQVLGGLGIQVDAALLKSDLMAGFASEDPLELQLALDALKTLLCPHD